MGLYEDVQEAVGLLKTACPEPPQVAIIPGTGLDGILERIDTDHEVPFEDIPGFAPTTATTHKASLVFGALGGKRVVATGGRHHVYEGHGLGEVTFPVRVLRGLGAEVLIVSNAAGGMNPHYRLGDLMLIEDHINLMGDTPLRGPNDERLGPRFPDMSAPYDAALIERAAAIARDASFRLLQAVLVAVPGPQLETRAEYAFLSSIGADVVGMSTVPEVITAVHAGLRVCALSVITDLCVPGAIEPVLVEKIIAVANEAAPRLEQLILGLLPHA